MGRASPSIEADCDRLRRDGYVVLRGLLDPVEVDPVAAP